MNKRNKGGQHFRKKVEKNRRERAIQNMNKMQRLIEEAAAKDRLKKEMSKRGDVNR